jgi:RimJ/RimL family protein N-acetyltransferase
MKIFTVLFAYGLADDLVRSYDARRGDNVTTLLFLHSRRPDVVEACEYLAGQNDVVYWPYGANRGVARSVNEAIVYAEEHGGDVFLSINDDVIAAPGDVQALAQTVHDHPECAYVEAIGHVERINRSAPLGFSFATLSMHAFRRIGYFDENFYPFWFEDTDWKRRAMLSGLPSLAVQTGAVHGGSKTLTHVEGEWDTFHFKFEPNREYYVRKWGGDQGAEQFRDPFNDDRYDLTIPREDLKLPYVYHPQRRPAFVDAKPAEVLCDPDKQLVLRPLSEADLPLILSWRNEPAIRRWFWHSDAISWDDHLTWYRTTYSPATDDVLWVIDWRGQPVGTTSLYHITPERAELGRLMIGDPSARGQHVAHDAEAMVRDWAFEQLRIQTIYATEKPGNRAVEGLNARLGFRITSETDDVISMEMMNPALERATA